MAEPELGKGPNKLLEAGNMLLASIGCCCVMPETGWFADCAGVVADWVPAMLVPLLPRRPKPDAVVPLEVPGTELNRESDGLGVGPVKGAVFGSVSAGRVLGAAVSLSLASELDRCGEKMLLDGAPQVKTGLKGSRARGCMLSLASAAPPELAATALLMLNAAGLLPLPLAADGSLLELTGASCFAGAAACLDCFAL